MKKLIPLFVITAFVWSSCTSKKAGEPKPVITNYFSATVNGVPETFTAKDSTRTNGANFIYITGSNDTTSDKIMLFLGSSNPIAAGTYNSDTGLEMLYGVGPGYTADNYYYTYDQTTRGTVTITSISSTNVKGTFSGAVVLESAAATDSDTRPIKTITDGKFDVDIK